MMHIHFSLDERIWEKAYLESICLILLQGHLLGQSYCFFKTQSPKETIVRYFKGIQGCDYFVCL